jgi:probable F420-dependent oxidoreductase
MRFVLGTAMLPPEFYVPTAQAAEDSGFDTVKVADSICYPEVSDSVYPYSPTGSREFLDGKPFLDPFVAMAAMGAATTSIRFLPSVLKLPMRHPVLVAKQTASVAALTGDRVALGVGSSPWPDDYEVLGIPMKRRGRRMDEALAIITGLLAGGYFEFHGQIYDIPSIKIDPVPARPVPILVGGHSDAALLRAARIGDGWIAATSGRDELPELVDRLNRMRAEAGRCHLPFEIHIGVRHDEGPDNLQALSDAGVTHLAVNFTHQYALERDTRSRNEHVDAIRRYGETVIGRIAERTSS